MAEVQSRTHNPTTRGRGGGRGGRGGFGGRNTTARRANGDKATAEPNTFDDDSDIAELRKQFGDKLVLIKELFENWSDADILYALKETDGDVEVTATRISDGTISQWGEVSKTKKPTPRPKTKPDTSSTGPAETSGNSRPARGGRSDGGHGGRGGRARGSERPRGSGRGRGAAHATTNGHRAKDNQGSVPTEEASAWSGAVATDESHPSENDSAPAAVDSIATAVLPTPAIPSDPAPEPTVTQSAPRTWASMLRQSTAPKPSPKPKETPTPKPAEVLEPLPPVEAAAPEPEPQPEAEEASIAVVAPVESSVPVETVKVVEPEVAISPPEDSLTKVNLDRLPDESQPPPTPTRASTAADSWDARQPVQAPAAVTPLSTSQIQQQASRSAASGYAATALKATERPAGRMPNYQRRFLEQEEAVRMPGNREVDRAAVQFGAFSLNGTEEDIDGDREDPETRTQPPAESPAAPRASLPPIAQPAPVPESFPPSQKLPASQPQPQQQASSATVTATPVAPPTGPASSTTQPPQAPSNNQAYGRFPQASSHESASFAQKPYDTFGQQPAATSATFDSFPATTTQAPGPQNTGAFSSGPEYSSYYAADQQSRNTYGGYYGYGQQAGQSHGEPNATSRPFGTYNASQNDHLSQYPQSGAQQSRYPGTAAASADAHNSGHNTPNPVGQNQQQTSGQGSQPQSNLHQQQPTYPYQHPYYSSPYYAQYMNQPYAGYGQGGYGGAPYGKGGVYGQGHQYGMSPQGPFDHATTAASVGFGQSSVGSRDTGLSSGMNDYSRGGTGQQSGAPGVLGSGGFGGVHDSYGRGTGFPSQGGQAYNATNAPTATPGSGNDDLKPYGDSKAASGPSPSLASAARPGSTTNPTSAASALPPPQSTQQGMGAYGGYPSHLAQGLHGGQAGASGYGLGGSGSQGHGNTPYGGYGGNQGFGSYYGGRQGHQGGWGGNYH